MNASSKIAIAFLFAVAAGGCDTTTDAAAGESASAALTVGALPSGDYRGGGDFVSPNEGESGPYRTTYAISGDLLDIHYSWGPKKGGTEEHVPLRLTWTSAHEFTFVFDGKSDPGGTGYCVNDRCHFSVASGDVVWFEMTLAFEASSVSALGSMRVGDRNAYWSETLQKL